MMLRYVFWSHLIITLTWKMVLLLSVQVTCCHKKNCYYFHEVPNCFDFYCFYCCFHLFYSQNKMFDWAVCNRSFLLQIMKFSRHTRYSNKQLIILFCLYFFFTSSLKNFVWSYSCLTSIIYKIFETNSSFHVKSRTRGKVQFLFFKRFLIVLAKFLFWQGDWALGYDSMKLGHFSDIS